MSTQRKETEVFNSGKPVEWGALAGTLIHVEATNGYHSKEVEEPIDKDHLPDYIEERFTREDIVELLLQGKQLETVLKRHPYASKEHGADQIEEGRRFPFDVWSDWKRSDKEVKRYMAMIEMIEADDKGEELLAELLKRWVTPLNFSEIAWNLHFSPNDIKELASDPSKSSLNEPTKEQRTSGIHRRYEWYQLMLKAFSVDDIVPLVLISELTIKSKNKPSIHQLYEGLQLYFGRLHWQTRMTNDDPEVKSKRMKEFKVIKAETEAAILVNLKEMAAKKAPLNTVNVNPDQS